MVKVYEKVKRDYLFLNSLYPGGDMMEIDAQVFDLMADPTKKRASQMYESAIQSWFSAIGNRFAEVPLSVLDNEEVLIIAERYFIDLSKFSEVE